MSWKRKLKNKLKNECTILGKHELRPTEMKVLTDENQRTQLEPNFDKIAIGWSSSKIVSGGPAL
jgi:hypothetical protein